MWISLILFLLFSTVNIRRINADQDCNEQQCVANMSRWCCPYNTTCADQNICNDIQPVNSRSLCSGQVTCFSGRFYWCCDTDQTCGDSHGCDDGSAKTVTVIASSIAVGMLILVIICGCYAHYLWLKRANRIQVAHASHNIEHLPSSFDLSTNNPLPGIDHHEQIHDQSAPSRTSYTNEQPPPSYQVAVSSAIAQYQNRI